MFSHEPCFFEVGQQADEFDAAVAIFHPRRDVAVLEIQRCQYGTGTESPVFVIATDCGMLAGHGRQIRRGIADCLDARGNCAGAYPA